MQRPVIVRPPRILASDDVLVDLLPARCRVTGHVDFGDDADTTGERVVDNSVNVGAVVGFAGGVGVLGHLGVGVDLDGPRLVVGNVPVKDVHLGQSKTVDLLLDLGNREVVASRVNHDATVGIVGVILNSDGLLNDEIATISNDDLLKSGESVQRSPNRLGSDIDGVAIANGKRVALIDTVLQFGRPIVDLDVNLAQAGATGGASLLLGRSIGERLEHGNGRLDGLRNPSNSGDGLPGALPGIVDEARVVRSGSATTSSVGVQRNASANMLGARLSPLNLLWRRQGVYLYGFSQGGESHDRRN